MSFTNSLNLGSAPNDGTGEPLRGAFQKLIANDVFLKAFAELIDLRSLANESNITDLEIDVADAEGNISVLQIDVADAEAAIALLQSGKITLAQARSGISENSEELSYNSTTGVLTHSGLRVDKVTRPEAANYTLQLTDMTVLFYATTYGAGTYTMPSDFPKDGQVFEIIDIQYKSSSNPLTINGNEIGGNAVNILDGGVLGASIVLNTDGETVRLKYFATENIYVKI